MRLTATAWDDVEAPRVAYYKHLTFTQHDRPRGGDQLQGRHISTDVAHDAESEIAPPGVLRHRRIMCRQKPGYLIHPGMMVAHGIDLALCAPIPLADRNSTSSVRPRWGIALRAPISQRSRGPGGRRPTASRCTVHPDTVLAVHPRRWGWVCRRCRAADQPTEQSYPFVPFPPVRRDRQTRLEQQIQGASCTARVHRSWGRSGASPARPAGSQTFARGSRIARRRPRWSTAFR
jgi:hypothetical protein